MPSSEPRVKSISAHHVRGCSGTTRFLFLHKQASKASNRLVGLGRETKQDFATRSSFARSIFRPSVPRASCVPRVWNITCRGTASLRCRKGEKSHWGLFPSEKEGKEESESEKNLSPLGEPRNLTVGPPPTPALRFSLAQSFSLPITLGKRWGLFSGDKTESVL